MFLTFQHTRPHIRAADKRPEALGTHADRPAAPHRLPRCESNEASPTHLNPRLVRGRPFQGLIVAHRLRRTSPKSPEPVLRRESMGLDQACFATTAAGVVCEKTYTTAACLASGPILRYRGASTAVVSVNVFWRSCSSPGSLPLASAPAGHVTDLNCCMPCRLAWS